jgi:K+-transporting ATPase c subunit
VLAVPWAYLVAVYENRLSFLDFIERPIYKMLGTSKETEQSWKRYASSMVVFSGVSAWKAVGVDNPTPDLVTTSGSELDPDLLPMDALVQVPMIAKARGLSPSCLQSLIKRETAGAELGFLGASYINVLALNEALAALPPHC